MIFLGCACAGPEAVGIGGLLHTRTWCCAAPVAVLGGSVQKRLCGNVLVLLQAGG